MSTRKRRAIPRVDDAAELVRGRKVRVYWNLHRGGWSVQTRSGADGGWRVACHADVVRLHEATTSVSEAGRQRVLRERKKNVHAYVIGWCINVETFTLATCEDPTAGRRLKYNPYRGPSFFAVGLNRGTGELEDVSKGRSFAAVAMYGPSAVYCW
jgi:hypothetical protein